MSWLHRSFNHHRPGRQGGRARTPVPAGLRLPTCGCLVPSIKRCLVASAVAVGVVGFVVVPVAVRAAIAMVAIIEAGARIGVERFIFVEILSGHGDAILITGV